MGVMFSLPLEIIGCFFDAENHRKWSKVEGRKLEGRRRTSFGSLVKRSIFINEILSHLNREMDAWKCAEKKSHGNGREMDKMKDR